MEPCSFEFENAVLDAPSGMTAEECSPLSVFISNALLNPKHEGPPVVISCWKPTQEELEEIQRTGRVWLLVCGGTMPPVSLHGMSPFQ